MPPSLVEELLADQQSLTAVEQFSRAHDEHALAGARYRNFIPLEAPRHGEQYAFEVELDKCSGCKACVTACHALNGLDDNETWREVGLLIPEPRRRRSRPAEIPNTRHSPSRIPDSVFQHITTACHHCVDPACLNGCPVLAYEKDPITGIVRHLDDQCIGCQYCVLKCPYDVPKYNHRLGIVRKCDMCTNRLAVGEAPACVQACPNEAIRITKVETSAVAIEFREQKQPFLPGAPAGDYTLPTTRYISSHVPKKTIAADAAALRPQPAHWPLVLMLVLSQAAVGVCGAAALAGTNRVSWFVALALGIASVVASVFHLGRPLGAWRFFLGLKRSWLSREILLFGIFIPALVTAVIVSHVDSSLSQVSKLFAAFAGLLGVFCSMMIYHDTQRVLWQWRRTAPLFVGTTFVLGLAGVLANKPGNGLLLAIFALALALKLLVEILVVRHVVDRDPTSLRKTALLITGQFQHVSMCRVLFSFAGVGAALLLHIAAFGSVHPAVAWLPFALVLAGELIERMLFFRTVDAPKMPGGLPT